MRAGGVALAAFVALALAGCGGAQQDAHEPSGKFKVEVHGSFPKTQKLAKRSTMIVTVKNVDRKPLPNPSVTVDSFNRNSTQANLADASRPVFIVNRGPRGGQTANQATSAFGHQLLPGQVATFKWSVTAVQAGPYKIKWTVSAGLFGKAIAVDTAGRENPSGLFVGKINNAAPHSTVNFKNGKTVEGG